MPKRRISKGRSAAQKAAQRKAAKASAAARKRSAPPFSVANDMRKPKAIRDAAYYGRPAMPTGKNTFLYHKTKDHDTADAIIKGRKWISGAASMGGIRGHSQFTHGGPLERFKIGGVLLGVTVPRKLVKKAQYEGNGVTAVVVRNSDLKGRKVKKL